MSAVEVLYIFDEHNTPLLEHVYAGRPPPSHIILPQYLSHPSPRPPLIYLPSTNPPTLLYSIIQDQLLFLSPCSSDSEPLQVLEFLHRVADALEDFLGSPLLASKVEGSYDVVAQVLDQMVDGGVVSCTEPNALRDVVDVPGVLKGILGGVGLPSSTPSSLAPSNNTPFSLSSRPSPINRQLSNPDRTSPVPWRRANVRHTSNELYVDIVETLSVTIAPSGRPLSALSNGTVAFTAKVSGVPDLLLQLSCPGGIGSSLALPVFHPCVRLNRWKDRPGELSFVPPDGRFVLAGYEVDLLGPAALDAFSTSTSKSSMPKLNIPATASVQTCLGPTGTDFEIRLSLNPKFAGSKVHTPGPGPSARGGRGGGLGGGFAGAGSGTSSAPTIEELVVHIPLPASVRNVSELRPSRGDAGYAPGNKAIEWRISTREIGLLMSSDRGGGLGATATLRGTVVGPEISDGHEHEGGPVSLSASNPYDYDEDGSSSYQSSQSPEKKIEERSIANDAKRIKANKVLMPSCVTVSFAVKGWLASGVKVESLAVDPKRSRGLGAGISPYKGVKYLCVSKKGVEGRC